MGFIGDTKKQKKKNRTAWCCLCETCEEVFTNSNENYTELVTKHAYPHSLMQQTSVAFVRSERAELNVAVK